MKRYSTFLLFVLLLTSFQNVFFDSAEAAGPKELRIARITPSGEDVPAGRQIVIQFNRPTVPLGRMDRRSDEIPIEITPPLNCEWRWLNTSALACQLKEKDALKESHRYKIIIQPGIKAEDGATIAKAYEHDLITERPQVRYTWVHNWHGPGMPIFRIVWNQPVTIDSVSKHVFMKYSHTRVPLKVEPDPDSTEKPRYVRPPGEPYWLDFGRSKKVKSDEALTEKDGIEARRVWLVSPKKEELPADTKVSLLIEPGLISAFGPETSIEDRELEGFFTFPEFRLIGLECTTNDGDEILIHPNQKHLARRCSPMEGFWLLFTSPINDNHVQRYIQLNPKLPKKIDEGDEEEITDQDWRSRFRRFHKEGAKYRSLVSHMLKAFQHYELKSKPRSLSLYERLKSYFVTLPKTDIKDIFGRPLKDPILIQFATDHRLPDFKLVHSTAVLEKQIESHVPLYVTNLDQVTLHYNSLSQDGHNEQQEITMNVPDVEDVSFAIPLKVRDLVPPDGGAIYGLLESKPFLDKHKWVRRLFAQVTPYQVHVKIGHFNTLVWVTDLKTGEPVRDVRVQVKKGIIETLELSPEILAQRITDANGMANLPGTETLDPELKKIVMWGDDDKEKMFLTLTKGKNIALIPLDHRFEISSFTVSNYEITEYQRKHYGHIETWGSTAQGIYRAGDTIQYKIYVRNQNNETLVPAPPKTYQLTVYDPTDKEVHTVKDITLSEFGAYHGEFKIPKKAAVGWYDFRLEADFADRKWYPLRVLVSDFTPSPFKVETSINGDLFRPKDTIEVETRAKLHSGGPYTEAQTRVTALVREKDFLPSHPISKSFEFDTFRDQEQKIIFQAEDLLNDRGLLNKKFQIPKLDIVYGQILIEGAVQDERGKSVTHRSTADYVGVDRLVGLKNTQWVYQAGETAEIQHLVVDERGKPVSGTDVAVSIERRVLKASRVKGAGNAYLKKYVEEWVQESKCESESKKEPSPCHFVPKQAGYYRITALIKDTKKREHITKIYAWVVGRDRVLWEEGDNLSLQIIPEQETYHVGDTARYLIKNPFPGAKALITIERYGALKSWTETLENSTPVIEFPVEPDFLPGFYLSVVVTSPRVEKPQGPGQVDLGKPAVRMGYVEVPVKDPYKEMSIDLKTDAPIYKPRDIVRVTLKAAPRHQDKKETIEVAVTVLDEAVFDLIRGGKKNFDPYEGFYKLDNLDMINLNLLTRLIGIQKFEKKGANPAGGGGGDVSMRSIFKFVSYWNPSLQTDDDGRATFEFEAPDNLTGWRILAMAVTPSDRMGLGDANFKVNRQTQIEPVMPNQVTAGDHFNAGFSIMNRTDQKRTLEVLIEAKGPIDTESSPTVSKQSVTLDPFKRTRVFMPLQTKAGRFGEDSDIIRFSVVAGDSLDRDGLIHKLNVYNRAPFETAADYGTSDLPHIETPILFPKDIRTDVGDLSVNLSPSIIGNIAGAFSYMADFPYSCWEQLLSKGVIAAHYQKLRDYLPADLEWIESKDLPKQILEDAADFQTPSGGMAFYIPEDTYASPYLSAYTALAFNWLRESGYDIPTLVEQGLHRYLENLLKQNVTPSYYTTGMSATVRAVALAALATHGKVTRQDLERFRSHVPLMSLFGQAHYLQAALKVQGSDDIIPEVIEHILSHSSQSGGKFQFNETLDDSYARILATPLRTQCGILSALVLAEQNPMIRPSIQGIPFKMVRAITQARGSRTHWENTQENMFCMNALIDYSRRYENVTPAMSVNVSLSNEDMGEAHFQSLKDPAITLNRSLGPEDPGRKAALNLEREGQGRLYYATQLRYALLKPKQERVNAGIEIRREYSVKRNNEWVLLTPAEIKRGDVVRVDIFVSLPTARHFVVVDDPVPGGLEPINPELATTSLLDAEAGEYKASGGSWWFQFNDWQHYAASRWCFYHQELRHDSVRFYSDYLPPGNYHLSYTAQAIATGQFSRLPVHAEEMYDPDVYGNGLPGDLEIGER